MKNYISHLYCMLFFCFLSIPGRADVLPQAWQNGMILLDGEVLKGEVYFDHELDVVFYKEEGMTKALTAQTVQSFSFKDERMGVTRSFQSLAQDPEALTGQKEFYEIVLEGDIVLARRSKSSRTFSSKGTLPVLPFLAKGRSDKQDIRYDYFLLDQEGLTKIRNFRKQVLPLMADRKEDMNRIIQKHNCNLQKQINYILLVNYYNHLKKEALTALK